MMTPDKNYKMKSSIKGIISFGRFPNAHDRGAWKRAMIDAQLCEEAARRAALKSKENEGSTKGKPRGAVAPD